jgi:hypothetical protein
MTAEQIIDVALKGSRLTIVGELRRAILAVAGFSYSECCGGGSSLNAFLSRACLRAGIG